MYGVRGGNNFMRTWLIILSCFLSNCSGSAGDAQDAYRGKPRETAPPLETAKTRYPSEDVVHRNEPAIDQRALDYGLNALSNKGPIAADYELRLWSSIDLTYYEKCFVARKTKNNWEASIIEPILKDGELIKDTKKLAKKKVQHLSAPNGGWITFEEMIVRNSLYPKLPFETDTPSKRPILDEGGIDLEVKQGTDYDIVSYLAFTETVDGKRVINICEETERLFNIRIGCRHR
jgi:hypothetical protein